MTSEQAGRRQLVRSRLWALLALGLPCWPARAVAADSRCPDASGQRLDARGTGPLPAGDGPADFGQVPEACPGLDVLSRLRGTVLVARGYPDYYGNLSAGTMLRLRYPLTLQTWMSVGLDVVTFRYVANAAVRSHGLGVGPPTVGLYRGVGAFGAGAVAIYGRLLLPLDTARASGIALGGEVGASVWVPLRDRFSVQGGVAVPVPIDITGGQAHAALRPAAVGEATWCAGRVVALFLGAAGHSEATPEARLLSISARVGLRLALSRGIAAALAGEIPLAGTDRTNAITSLFVGWTPAREPAPPGTRLARE